MPSDDSIMSMMGDPGNRTTEKPTDPLSPERLAALERFLSWLECRNEPLNGCGERENEKELTGTILALVSAERERQEDELRDRDNRVCKRCGETRSMHRVETLQCPDYSTPVPEWSLASFRP